MTTRRITRNGIIAALYAALTLVIAPIGYGPIQFRISESLKALVLFDPWLVVGIGVGTFIANWFSPFAGGWELIWMPVSDMLGGLLAWAIYRALRQRYIVVPCIVYAMTTALSVALMLWAIGIAPFWFSVLTVGIGELVAIVGGLPIMLRIKPWVCKDF